MRIGLAGTISAGKTTLVKALAELPQFKDYKISTERSKYLRDLGIPLNTDSTAKGQAVFLAERVSELFSENMITDRTIIDVIAFTFNSKEMNNDEKKLFMSYAQQFIKEYDYIFYVNPEGVLIEDNGVRETNSEYRDLIDDTILNMFNLYGWDKVHEIKGTTEERIKSILDVVKL